MSEVLIAAADVVWPGSRLFGSPVAGILLLAALGIGVAVVIISLIYDQINKK